MRRSVCQWLTIIAAVVIPTVGEAQTMIGQSHLAPVALEARCRFADSMLEGPRYLVAMGSDPLHASILREDIQNRRLAADPAAEKDRDAGAPHKELAGPVEPQRCQPFPPPEPFCPFAELAAAEPIDVEFNDTPRSECAATSVVSSPAVENATYPLDARRALPLYRGRENDGHRFAGASPVIATLDAADLPFDVVGNSPLRFSLQPIGGPRYCLLDWEAPAPVCSATGGEKSGEVRLSDWLPSDAQWEGLRRLWSGMQPELPIACWMEEIIWQLEYAAAIDGPVRPHLQPRRLGAEVAAVTRDLLDRVARWSRPAVPVLAHTVEPPPAPQPQQDLQLAAAVLLSAAGELESIAGRLRVWGDGLHRIAKVPAAPLRR